MPEPSQRLLKMPPTSGKVETISLRDLGHELEIVGSERAGHPHVRHFPVAALPALGIHGDPVGMVAVDVFVGGVRIGPGDHGHAELPAAFDHLAEVIGTLREPAARTVVFDLGRDRTRPRRRR